MMIRMFFDIETQANPETFHFMPEPEAPGNLKDPEKIAAAIAAKKSEMIERAALDPDYGKMLALSFCSAPDKPISVITTFDMTEVDLLKTFWDALATCNGCAVGYNILSFDIPYMLRRSMALGVVPPVVVNLAKYRTEPITDLYAILYNWGPGKGLKQVAKMYGLVNECPDIDGSKVAGLNKEELVAYAMSDTSLVCQLYNKMNGIYFKH